MDYNTSMSPADMAAVMGNNNGYNDGFGGGAWWWIIILFLFGMNGGWGRGFGGGYGNGGMADIYPWMNQQAQMNDGFRDQMIANKIDNIQNGVTAGFGGVQNSLCSGFAGVTAGLNNGFAQAEIAANSRQMANMNQMFGLQTGLNTQLNTIAMNQQNCCCENRAAVADVKYTVADQACLNRNQSMMNTRDIIDAVHADYQSLKDQLFNDKMDAKNDTIAQLRSELMYARGQASQDVQTAAIQAGQRALANEVEQYVAPMARPAYVVQNPYCCNQSVYGQTCGNCYGNAA
mgnify:CR=1 FL=1